MAIASSLTVLGNLLGPIIGGAIAGAQGLTAVFFANSVLLVGASILVWRSFEEPAPIVPTGTTGRGIPDEPLERPPHEQT
jgi:MFS family permease